MKGPESMDNFGYRTHEATPRVDRNAVLEAIKKLKGENNEVDLKDLNDPDVKKVYDLFTAWVRPMDQIENAQDRLISYLEEHMLMYDAGLVTKKEALQQIDQDLKDELEQIKDDNFIELERMIGEYRKDIAEKLKKA